MSEQTFKRMLREILAGAIESDRDKLLTAFQGMVEEAMDQRLSSMSFAQLVSAGLRDTLNSSLAPQLHDAITARVDRMIVQQMRTPEIQSLITERSQAWIESDAFSRLVAERTSLHLRGLLYAIIVEQYPPDPDEDEKDV